MKASLKIMHKHYGVVLKLVNFSCTHYLYPLYIFELPTLDYFVYIQEIK
jgi:hypothetical protein